MTDEMSIITESDSLHNLCSGQERIAKHGVRHGHSDLVHIGDQRETCGSFELFPERGLIQVKH
ncbi:hypothetical protein D3C81_1698210 [compost metagenome]